MSQLEHEPEYELCVFNILPERQFSIPDSATDSIWYTSSFPTEHRLPKWHILSLSYSLLIWCHILYSGPPYSRLQLPRHYSRVLQRWLCSPTGTPLYTPWYVPLTNLLKRVAKILSLPLGQYTKLERTWSGHKVKDDPLVLLTALLSSGVSDICPTISSIRLRHVCNHQPRLFFSLVSWFYYSGSW